MKKLFSLIPLYAVLAVLYLIAMSAGMVNIPAHATIFTTVLAGIIGAFSGISSIISVFSHIDQLASLKRRKQELINDEEHLKEMKEHVKLITDSTDLDENLLAKSNVDHPIVSALSHLAQAERSVRDSKDRIAYTRSSIDARKTGPFKWVVDMYGEE